MATYDHVEKEVPIRSIAGLLVSVRHAIIDEDDSTECRITLTNGRNIVGKGLGRTGYSREMAHSHAIEQIWELVDEGVLSID